MFMYKDRIKLIHRNLGIPEDYETAVGLILQMEADELENIETDIYGRPQKLFPAAADACP